MGKKICAVIFWLIEEAKEKTNEQLQSEIQKGMECLRIPWMEKIEKVTVLETP